jgi:hypothetical protein
MDVPEDFTLTSNGHHDQINTDKIYVYFYICGDFRVLVSFSFFIVKYYSAPHRTPFTQISNGWTSFMSGSCLVVRCTMGLNQPFGQDYGQVPVVIIIRLSPVLGTNNDLQNIHIKLKIK